MLDSIYQLKVTLRGVKPRIWRRIAVPSSDTLEQLHWVTALSMGWLCYHCFNFTIDGEGYISDYSGDGTDGINGEELARLHTLGDTVTRDGQDFEYRYDFGDGWDHRIEVESLDCGVALPQDPGLGSGFLPPDRGWGRPQGHPLGVCLAGEGACPPEDVGGPFGYREFLKIMSDPRHPEYKETSRWFTGVMQSKYYPDPTAFSVDVANIRLRQILKKVFRRWREGSLSGYVLKKRRA
jgi:hypothetical protein